ncbi:hypothetical protein ACWDA3_57045 [Nonomuraea rubra]
MLTSKAEPATEAARRHGAELQRRARGWFYLMHSPYWRRHIAIYMGECDHGIILQANSSDELGRLMNNVAPPGWQAEGLPRLSRRNGLPSPQRGRG